MHLQEYSDIVHIYEYIYILRKRQSAQVTKYITTGDKHACLKAYHVAHIHLSTIIAFWPYIFMNKLMPEPRHMFDAQFYRELSFLGLMTNCPFYI